ncbi:Hypothetical_protein [Hexamita inflata]|uniref:Hypothetical_protein n=1 Tax=Hexamita inflata TaxID=28002 RepID=A0AA86RB74_9EUKA|nr:Hypothetical protein HINF_LOCUS58376 [Hexamita inflata]
MPIPNLQHNLSNKSLTDNNTVHKEVYQTLINRENSNASFVTQTQQITEIYPNPKRQFVLPAQLPFLTDADMILTEQSTQPQMDETFYKKFTKLAKFLATQICDTYDKNVDTGVNSEVYQSMLRNQRPHDTTILTPDRVRILAQENHGFLLQIQIDLDKNSIAYALIQDVISFELLVKHTACTFQTENYFFQFLDYVDRVRDLIRIFVPKKDESLKDFQRRCMIDSQNQVDNLCDICEALDFTMDYNAQIEQLIQIENQFQELLPQITSVADGMLLLKGVEDMRAQVWGALDGL